MDCVTARWLPSASKTLFEGKYSANPSKLELLAFGTAAHEGGSFRAGEASEADPTAGVVSQLSPNAGSDRPIETIAVTEAFQALVRRSGLNATCPKGENLKVQ